jgi:hypothetical protein
LTNQQQQAEDFPVVGQFATVLHEGQGQRHSTDYVNPRIAFGQQSQQYGEEAAEPYHFVGAKVSERIHPFLRNRRYVQLLL